MAIADDDQQQEEFENAPYAAIEGQPEQADNLIQGGNNDEPTNVYITAINNDQGVDPNAEQNTEESK